MATYNRGGGGYDEPLVERAIKSFLYQDYENCELIILNDGSTDNTSEIISKYADNPKIKIYDHKHNLRPPNNWNFLWDKSDGDLICQLHDDDELTPDSISVRVKLFQDNPELHVVYGGIFQNNLAGTDQLLFPGQPVDIERIWRDEYINFTTLMYKRDIDLRFDTELRYYFDWFFKIQCLMRYNVSYTKEPVMYYTVHMGQESNRCKREGMNDIEEKKMRTKLKEIYGDCWIGQHSKRN